MPTPAEASVQDQFEFHCKPTGWPLCPHCGAVVRAGVAHRALRASEFHTSFRGPGLWVKRISIAFGMDWDLVQF